MPKTMSISDLKKLHDSLFLELLPIDHVLEKSIIFNPIINNFLKNLNESSFQSDKSPKELNEEFSLTLPISGHSLDETLTFLQEKIIPNFKTVSGKKFFGYVPSSPTAESYLAGMLTPLFNQFAGSVLGSPGAAILEGLALQWIIQMLGYSPNAWGTFTSGGSMANLSCLFSALTTKAPYTKKYGLFGSKKLIAYISDQTHNAVVKSLLLFGLGNDNIRRISSNDNFELTADSVRKELLNDLKDSNNFPFLIVATVGTTNTGAIDDLEGLSSLAEEFNLWLHIDGAYGGFSKLTDFNSEKTKYIEKAHSIALDAHKWFFTTFEAGISLVKNKDNLYRSFDMQAEYYKDSRIEDDFPLQRNPYSYGFNLSREMKGFKVWMNIYCYGKDGMTKLITRNILQAQYLTALIEQKEDLELLAQTTLSIVNFRWKESDEFNDQLVGLIQKRRNYYLSKTELKGRSTIRVCIVNQNDDLSIIDGFLNEVIEIGKILLKEKETK
jgi:glutamate/tyrosine decarboxylase-like PLP-dependent enzyme